MSIFKRPEKPLSKKLILEYISQEEIYGYYTEQSPRTKTLFRSPLRDDKNPTCKFIYTDHGTLMMKDWSGHFLGNCFDFVMVKYGVDLKGALRIIASDFCVREMETKKKKKPVHKIIKQTKRITYSKRNWGREDDLYWDSYCISREIRAKFNIHPVQYIWIDGDCKYGWSKNDPAYAYDFGNGEVKIYFPRRKVGRFLCNTSKTQGVNLLPETGDLLVITKSYKDVAVLYYLGISAVAPQSETTVIDKKEIENYKRRFKTIVSLYDFDLTGIRTANKLKRIYGIRPLFFTNGRFGSYDMGSKDASDAIQLRGSEKMKQLASQIRDRLLQDTLFYVNGQADSISSIN